MAERASPNNARLIRKSLANAKWGLLVLALLYFGAAMALSDNRRSRAFAGTQAAHLVDVDAAETVRLVHSLASRQATYAEISMADDPDQERALVEEPAPPEPEPEAVEEPVPAPAPVALASAAPLPARAPVQPAPAPAPRPAPAPAAPPPAPAAPPSSLVSQLLAAHNAERARVGVGPLAYDAALGAVAQRRAADMAARGYFGHVSPTGETAYSLMDAAGISYGNAGENLAWTTYAETEVFSQCMSNWLASPSHAANIRSGAYTRVGFGVAVTGGKTYVAAVFAGP